MADNVILKIRDRIVEMIGAMDKAGGFNFDYNPKCINTNDGDLYQAISAGEDYDDVFPIVEVRLGGERPLFTPDTAVNGNISLNDRDFFITVMSYYFYLLLP